MMSQYLSVLKLPILLAMMLFLASCQEAEPLTHLQQIEKRNTLVVGTLVGPSTYYQAAEQEQGFEYELAHAFADFLGVELKIVPFFSLSELFSRLESGSLDVIASGLSVTPERASRFKFGPEYRNISQKLVFKQDKTKRPRSFGDIQGDLMVLAQSSHSQSLERAKATYPELVWQETTDLDEYELLQAILDEKITYTIADSHTLAKVRRFHPELSIGFSVTRNEPVAWFLGQSQDDSLYALMIEFFGKMQRERDLLVLEEKYFGHVRKFNYVNTLAFIEAVRDTLPKYQGWFEQYARTLDWRLLAALSYQESMWDPRAKSPTGVRGIMMLTQPTAKAVGVTNRLEPEQNIRGGAIYLEKLINRMPQRIPSPDRIWFALASYNVGWGHVNDARILTQRDGGDPDKWVDVKRYLPLLIKKRYYRTTKYGYARGDVAVHYVDNIRRYYDTLTWLSENGELPDGDDAKAASEAPQD